MNKNLCIILFLLSALISIQPVTAQISKGSAMFGGSINFYGSQNKNETTPGEKSTTSGIGVTPLFGKAIKNNLLVGGDISYGRYSNSRDYPGGGGQSSKTNSDSYGVGAFVRGYRNLGNSGFYLYLQNRIGVQVSSGKTSNSNPGYDYRNNGMAVNLNLSPGVAYAITERMHIETGLDNLFYVEYTAGSTKYSGSERKSTNRNFSGGIGIGGTSSFSVGVKWIILPK